MDEEIFGKTQRICRTAYFREGWIRNIHNLDAT